MERVHGFGPGGCMQRGESRERCPRCRWDGRSDEAKQVEIGRWESKPQPYIAVNPSVPAPEPTSVPLVEARCPRCGAKTGHYTIPDPQDTREEQQRRKSMEDLGRTVDYYRTLPQRILRGGKP